MTGDNPLCDNHWANCLANIQGKEVEVCESCPTRPENRDAWERLLVNNRLDRDGMRTLLISQQRDLDCLRKKLRANTTGMVQVEARWNMIKWMLGISLAVAGLIVSLLAVITA